MTLPLWGADQSPRRFAEPRRLSLVRLAGEIAQALSQVGPVAVEGEVHRPATSMAGRVYFTLRDRAAQISVTFSARNARRCRALAGERVLVVGQLFWSNERGQLLLEASQVTPTGEGAVAAMIAEARARLAADGLLDRPRRRLPKLPRLIGVVCGADAAVRKDIESVVAAQFPGYPVLFEETYVSGPGAALSITEALERISAVPEVDVVILARGGGDATALLPWSDEELCRAIASAPVPVVSAIGHESDRPLCDEVADARFGTPSIAAGNVVPDRRALEEHLAGLLESSARSLRERRELCRQRLRAAEVSGALAAGLERSRSRLAHAADGLTWVHPRSKAELCRRRLAAIDWRSPFLAQAEAGRRRLEAASRHAWSLSPRHVVERGFAVARRADGSVVRDPAELAAGELLELSLARGVVTVQVVRVGAAAAEDTVGRASRPFLGGTGSLAASSIGDARREGTSAVGEARPRGTSPAGGPVADQLGEAR
jgi:exodeoxyribonuclease VII large subunit